jgi:phospholipase A1/A2
MSIAKSGGSVVTAFTYCRLAGAAMLLAIGLPAAAADPAVAKELADCAAKEDKDARLACYDQLAGRTAPSAAAPVASAPGAPRAAAPSASAGTAGPSLLTKAWDLDDKPEIFSVRPYKPVYLLPIYHASAVNASPYSPTRGYGDNNGMPRKTEAKYQISFKTKLAHDLIGDNGDLWAGYTQSSRWQVYNSASSRPFRETDYEPEAMFVWRTNFPVLGMAGRYVSVGINHQSNGQSDPLSRSWNRITAAVGLDRGDWTLTVRPWWRLPEHGANDDNPDLVDYAGRGELLLTRTDGNTVLAVEARHSLRAGDRNHGSLRFDFGFSPLKQNKDLKLHVQWFTGYAESLIDYNHHANYLGLGISLVEWHNE